ncbi:MAG: Druantia anti-phage system protein DruA [Gammaproteobacteria bacterium]
MEPILFRYRGRDLKGEDIAWMREAIAAHYARGRSFIAQVLCEHWAWRQPNGAYKGFAARDLLLRLEEAGHVILPPRKAVKNNRAEPRFDHIPRYAESPLSGRVGDHPAPRIVEACGPERYLWDYLVHHYHYLGRPQLVGEHLKALVFIEAQVVGCLGWASAAWKSAARERWIGWSVAQKRARLYLLTNNVRFLILPWVRVEHLASKILAMSVRGLSAAWQTRYGHAVVLAETFVDLSRFQGTCYRAANWRYLGTTQGHAKRGNAYHRHGVAKALYLYPLHRAFRETLTAP